MRDPTKPPMELIKDSMKKDLNSPLTFKNFSFKNTFIGDWQKFLFFLFLMFMSWSYFHDTNECRELIENKEEVCTEYLNYISENNQLNIPPFNDGDSWNYNQPDKPDYIP